MNRRERLLVYPAGPVAQNALDGLLRAAGFRQMGSVTGELTLMVERTAEVCRWPQATVSMMGTPTIRTEAEGCLPAAVIEFFTDIYEGFEFCYEGSGVVQGILGQTQPQ